MTHALMYGYLGYEMNHLHLLKKTTEHGWKLWKNLETLCKDFLSFGQTIIYKVNSDLKPNQCFEVCNTNWTSDHPSISASAKQDLTEVEKIMCNQALNYGEWWTSGLRHKTMHRSKCRGQRSATFTKQSLSFQYFVPCLRHQTDVHKAGTWFAFGPGQARHSMTAEWLRLWSSAQVESARKRQRCFLFVCWTRAEALYCVARHWF